MTTIAEPPFSLPRLADDARTRDNQIEQLHLEVLRLESRYYKWHDLKPRFVFEPLADSFVRFLSSVAGPAMKPAELKRAGHALGPDPTTTWDHLQQRKFYLENHPTINPNVESVLDLVLSALDRVKGKIEYDRPDDGVVFAPLVYLFPDPLGFVDRLWSLFTEGAPSRCIVFRPLVSQLRQNAANLFITPDKAVAPAKSTLGLEHLIEAYFGNTAFANFLLQQVCVRWDYQKKGENAVRFEHTHILGGWGAGKTSLLKRMLHRDIKDPAKPSIVIIDPHSELTKELTSGLLGSEDRIIYINPRDVLYPPAFNLFAMTPNRMASYDPAMREQVRNSVLQTFDYFLTGLLGTELTGKQGIPFRSIVRLLLTFPDTLRPSRNATIRDMLRLVDEEPPVEFLPAIASLDTDKQRFFREFLDPKNAQWRVTKSDVRYRLDGLLDDSTMKNFLTAPETKVDLFEELNKGAIIVIDTAEDFLGSKNSTALGKLFIALIFQAILQRAPIPEEERHPTFLYVDEASQYFDDTLSALMRETRKFRLGCIFSHHGLHEKTLTPDLQRSLLGAASQFACLPTAEDAARMAADLRTTKEFLLALPKFTFGTYVRGVTPHAVPSPVASSIFDLTAMVGKAVSNNPEIKDVIPYLKNKFIDANRKRVSFGPAGAPVSPPTPTAAPNATPSPQSPANDISKEW